MTYYPNLPLTCLVPRFVRLWWYRRKVVRIERRRNFLDGRLDLIKSLRNRDTALRSPEWFELCSLSRPLGMAQHRLHELGDLPRSYCYFC